MSYNIKDNKVVIDLTGPDGRELQETKRLLGKRDSYPLCNRK